MKTYGSFSEMFNSQSSVSVFNKWGQARYAHDKSGKYGVVARFWENDDDPEEQDIYYAFYSPKAEDKAVHSNLQETGNSLLEGMVISNKPFCFGIVRKMLVDGEDIIDSDDKLVTLLKALNPEYVLDIKEFEPGKLGKTKE